MSKIRVKLTFTEELLGTANADPDIHEKYIASLAPDAPTRQEEVEAIGADAEVEKSRTVFSRDAEGNPILWDYQIRGFFKSAAKAGNYIGGDSKLTNYKGKIDQTVFIDERQIRLNLPEGKTMGDCQRPLRAETAQGARVALANSETLPAGTTCEFTINMLAKKTEKDKHPMEHYVREWLDYGQYNGIGQWRNSGKGRFTWEELPLPEEE